MKDEKGKFSEFSFQSRSRDLSAFQISLFSLPFPAADDDPCRQAEGQERTSRGLGNDLGVGP